MNHRITVAALVCLLAGCSSEGPAGVTPPPVESVDLSGTYRLLAGFSVGDGPLDGVYQTNASCPDGSAAGRLVPGQTGSAEFRGNRIVVTHSSELHCGGSVTVTQHADSAVYQLTPGLVYRLDFSAAPGTPTTRLVEGVVGPVWTNRQITIHFRGRHDERNEMVMGLRFGW